MRFTKKKLAAVPKPVKMYRRATEILAAAKKPSAFHGVNKPADLKEILSTGTLRPEGTGTHGKGVYFWKHRPRQTYMNKPTAPGIILPQKKLEPYKPPIDPNPNRADRRHMLVRPGNLKLPRRASVSATPEQLRESLKGIKKHRLRQIDSAIWHRAEADMAARARGGESFPPTKRELIRLLKRKDKPKTFRGGMRGGKAEEVAAFLDDYDDQLWR